MGKSPSKSSVSTSVIALKKVIVVSATFRGVVQMAHFLPIPVLPALQTGL